MIQIISIIFTLFVIPFCIGLLPANFISDEKTDPGVIMLAGYVLMWAVFGVITIPAVILIQYDNFLFVVRLFAVVSVLTAMAGLVTWFMRWKKKADRKLHIHLPDASFFKNGLEVKIEWLLFLAIVGFQLYMAFTRASFDGDDAYYVVQSRLAQQTGNMYKYLPYTGGTTRLDIRHAMAVFPMWIAYVAKMAGIHATIVSHVVMPLVLIPLSYLVYYEIAKALFARKKENAPIFMIIMGMFQMFGNVSIYTNETFFLTRTWQGKSVICSFVIPMMFLLLLWMFGGEPQKGKTDTGLWIMLVCLNLTTGICSSLSVVLVTFLLAAAALCLMVVERDWKIPLKLGLACIPNAVYVLIYLMLA